MFDIMIPHGNGGKMALTVPCVAVRGSTGISLGQGPPSYEPVTTFPKDDSKLCRVMLFSPDGRYFAWTNGVCVKIVLCNTWKVIKEIKKPKVNAIRFSSKGTYFMTWEPYTATLNNPQGSPNLHIWKTESNELVKSFVQKKQSDWEPQWSSDEKVCGILMGADVMFYEDANFEKIVHRINIATVAKFSIAPNNAPYHILCYVPGKSGQPSLGRLFQYPKFQSTQALANKSFFQADRVDIYWNQKGTSALLMTSTEIDKASYYGKQTLHYVNTKSETAMVMFSKEGPIYSVQWSPKNTEFCVVYGFMPAKATLFNLKCEPIFEFGALHRNSIYYNPHGNIMILAGFGNLSGCIQLWDVVNKKLIAEISAPDTTLLEWSPDGEHFMTATTTPRLRMGNGFKIWHYSGTLLYERPWNKQEELWEVLWQTFPSDTFKEKPISYKAVEGIAPSQPQASKQVYRPPSARGTTITFKLHDDEEFGPKPTSDSNPSKAALKAKKKREAKKAKKELELQTSVNAVTTGVSSQSQTSNPTINGQVSNNSSKNQSNVVASESDLMEDPEKQKKIKRLKSKLDQISKLKEQLSAGKQLEINQLEKIKKEAELVKELEELIL